MATVLESAVQKTLTRTERTWRATIETPRGQPYSLSVHRQVVTTDEHGDLVGVPVQAEDYHFPFDDIKTTPVTLGNTTLTIEQIAGFTQAAFDILVAAKKQADIDAAQNNDE